MEAFELPAGDLPEELLKLLPESVRERLEKERSPKHQLYHKALAEMMPKPSEMYDATARLVAMDDEAKNHDRLFQRAMATDNMLDFIGDESENRAQGAVRLGLLYLMFERFHKEMRDEKGK